MKNIHNIKENIYITNNEEIKDGDWCLHNSRVKQATQEVLGFANKFAKKIILTTDQDLIKDGVQAIDDNFLEWFVKNPSCEFVEVRKEKYSERFDNDKSPIGNPDTWGNRWLIIIPKEESCDNCNNEICCCIIRTQETLEEVAKRLYPLSAIPRKLWLRGAKWQQEQCKKDLDAHDEEVLRIITSCKEYLSFGDEFNEKKWFEQFKKK
jgi:hypothetical protein